MVATTRKLPWMRSAVPKKREEATSKSKPKAAASNAGANSRAKGAKKKSKGKEDEEPEEEMKPEASASTSSKPQGEEMAREEDEDQEEEVAKKPAQPKPSTKRPENMIKAIEGRAGDPAKKPTAAAQVGGGRLKTRLNRRRNNNLAAVAKADEEEEEEEEVEKPPVSGTTSSSAGALDELPTQLDVPLLATSTQLDELPTQMDHSPLRSARGRAKTKRAKAERVVASRSPSLSPNPYHLLDQATQSDSPMPLLSASSSPLTTPPRSPTTPSPQHSSYLRHLDSPTQHDGGAPRSPWALSPVAPSSPSSPGTTGKRKRRTDKAKKAKAALASSSSTTTTGPTASQWRRLMSQATQTDLISSSPSLSQSQSQGDSSVAYDDLDAMLGQPTQTEDEVRCHISQSSDLLHRPTQSDDGGLLGGVSPIRLRSGGRERNLGPPSPCASPLRKGWRGGDNNAGGLRPKGKALEEDTSLDTSLLLLDTSTQDDEVYLDDYATKGGVYEDDEDDEDASSSWKAASKKNAEKKNKEKRTGLSPDSLDSSLMGPTQEDPPSSLMRAPTQVDALNTSTQIDLSMFVLSDTEGESLGSIPTQADLPAFNLLGSSGAGLPPTLTDDNPTQIDSQPTQLDTSLGASSLVRPLGEQSTDKKRKTEKKEKRNSNKKAAIQDTPTLVDALVYEPTPPLEFEDEESPGFGVVPAKSKKRKIVDEDEGTNREQAAGAKRRSRGEERGHTTSEQGNKATEKRSEHSSRSRPGAGDRQEEEEEEYGPFGKLVSLNPKFKSVVIPEDGDESNDTPSLELSPSDGAPECRYGVRCYRKNPQHLKQFKHPSFEVVVEDTSTNGTYINEVLVGRGATQTLQEGQELSLVLGVTDRPTDVPFELIAYRYERKPTSST